MNTPAMLHQPTAIVVQQRSRMLEVGFDDGNTFRIPFELMRVCKPGLRPSALKKRR